ncbi:MAG TPA: MBL fold metallo-hydrolase [Feifaniaceae bacterium]|nr:MBL fold metallo-hydrolase [Feifaniaceae bacterium]
MEEQLVVLGTGNAMSLNYYNTCFAMQKGEDYFLVDAGGGNGILVQLQKAGIPMKAIRHMFISHAHSDHVLGALWVIRVIGNGMLSGSYPGVFTVWCAPVIWQFLTDAARLTLIPGINRLLGERILFRGVGDGMRAEILGYTVSFMDIHSNKLEQHAFTLKLSGGGKLSFLGDEPCRETCLKLIEQSEWLLSEAFCLYAHRARFRPYEKHHATVKDACELAERLQIPNLLLWHTEDETFGQRQALYLLEGRKYYSGRLFVPQDLTRIPLNA